MTELLNGKEFAKFHGQHLQAEIDQLKEKGIFPHFCVINIGDDPASAVYVRTKKRKAEKLGIQQDIFQLPSSTTEAEVFALIDRLNQDPEINGIMVQLPMPKHLDPEKVLDRIDPEKDVDGLTSTNVGRLWQGSHFVEPATAAGIIALLKHYGVELTGKNCVIIGRSNIVGKPLAALMLEENATVSILHSKTQNLAKLTKTADILVSAVGQAGFVTKDMIKPGAVVIDVGINRVDGKLVGDVAFDEVSPLVKMITPVPGGIGPITVEFLMEGVIKLTRRQYGR